LQSSVSRRLMSAYLKGIAVANKEHVKQLKQGVAEWNAWRKALHRANLSGTNLSGTNLSGTNLYGAKLSGADLPRKGTLVPARQQRRVGAQRSDPARADRAQSRLRCSAIHRCRDHRDRLPAARRSAGYRSVGQRARDSRRPAAESTHAVEHKRIIMRGSVDCFRWRR
jgi:hypothetical protein